MKLVEYGPESLDAYRIFLQRLGAHSDRLSLDLPFAYYGASPGVVIKRYLLIDEKADPQQVLGAFNVKLQDYVLAGQSVRVAVVTYPVSLGQVEPRYAMVGVLLFRKLAEAYPINYLLGMGPPDSSPAARLSSMLGWRLDPIPYLFRPNRLGNLVAKRLESRPLLASAAGLAARLGLFLPAESIFRLWSRRARPAGRLELKPAETFDASVDAFWRDYQQEVGFSLVRDQRQLNAIYPATTPQFKRLVFEEEGRVVGFAVLLVPSAEGRGRFGQARVATLVDLCLRDAALESGVAGLSEHLFRLPVDAVIVNTPHRRTLEALTHRGFLHRVTGMYLATSPKLQALLDNAAVTLDEMVLTRGDGDGPIGLGVDLT